MGEEWSLQNTYSIFITSDTKRKKFNLLNFTNVNKFSNTQRSANGVYCKVRCYTALLGAPCYEIGGTPYCAMLGDMAARVQWTLRTVFSSEKLKVSDVTQHYLY